MPHRRSSRDRLAQACCLSLLAGLPACGTVDGLDTLLADFEPERIATLLGEVLVGGSAGDVAASEPVTGAYDAKPCVAVGVPSDPTRQEMFRRINEHRARHGLNRLDYSRSLQRAADAYARRLSEEAFFSHTSPDGLGPGDRAMEAGFCDTYVGENIAYGLNRMRTAGKAMDAFIGSPDHNTNLLTADWDYVGLGYLHVGGYVGGRYWWVQLFGTDSGD